MNWLADISIGTGIDYRYADESARFEQARFSRANTSLFARGPRGLSVLVSTAVAQYREWSQARKAFFKLQELDDRMLADIGLHRGDISSIANTHKAAPVNGSSRYYAGSPKNIPVQVNPVAPDVPEARADEETWPKAA